MSGWTPASPEISRPVFRESGVAQRTGFGQPPHHPVDRRPSRWMDRFGGVQIGLGAGPAVDPPLEDPP